MMFGADQFGPRFTTSLWRTVAPPATPAEAHYGIYEGTIGTLRPGANADITLIERRPGNFELKDSDGNIVTAKERLITRTTLKDGRVWYERPAE